MMRYVLMLFALLAVLPAWTYGQDLRQPPAPDDLFDPDLIELDLDAIVAEKEKLLSVSFTMGLSQKDLGTSEQQAVSIASIKSIFDALAAEFEAATGIDVSWRRDSFEEFSPAFNFALTLFVRI